MKKIMWALIVLGSFILFYLVMIYPARGQFHRGGFGNFFAGAVSHSSTSLQRALNAGEIMGGNLQLNSTAFTFGGAGYSVRPGGWVIGGSGYAYELTSRGRNGRIKLDNGGGFINIGYRVVAARKWLGFPYAGMGGYGANFRIHNTSDKTLVVGADSVSSGKMSKYSTGGMAFDMGFALKYFAFNPGLKKNHRSSGTVVGIDVGGSCFPSFERWRNIVTEDEVRSIERPFIMVAYVRATIGLGVFSDDSGGPRYKY